MLSAARIGFVVPVYRPPLDVFEAMLQSVAAQSIPDWECILVDDGSDDRELTERLASATADPRFRLIVAERNGGIAAATNLGLAELRAPVFALADHDDLIAHDAAEVVLSYFDDPAVGIVYSDESTVDGTGVVIATHRKPDFAPIRLQGQHYLNHLMAARTELIGDLRVRTEYEPTQDLDFVVRLIDSAERAGQRVAHIPRPLYGWRAIEGSSAVDVAEKPGMVNAAFRSFQTELERRGTNVELTNALDAAGRLTASCVLQFPLPAAADIDLVPIDAGSDVGSIVAAIADGAGRFVALVPEVESASDDWVRVVASEAAREEVAMAGPCIVDSSNRVVSTGRVVVPTLADLFAGQPLDDGPFGANQVTREASALHPLGLVIDRSAFAAAGIELAVDSGDAWADSLDVIVAAWGLRLQRRGLATVWTPRARLVVADAVGSPDRVAWDRWVEVHGQPGEHFSPGGSAPPMGARHSRRQRLDRALQRRAELVATVASAASSPPIAATVSGLVSSGIRVRVVGTSGADDIVGSTVESIAETVHDVETATTAAIDELQDEVGAGVVIAGDASELWADARLRTPIISGGTQGAIDGVSLVPVTPYPWPDWIEWERTLASGSDLSPEAAQQVAAWLFELGPEEPDPNAQIGVALGPLLVAISGQVVAAARCRGNREVVLSPQVALVGDALRLWRAADPSERAWLTLSAAGGASDDALYVGWDETDRSASGGDNLSIIGDQEAGSSPPNGIVGHGWSRSTTELLRRFLGPGDERADEVSPGLAATRQAALRFAEFQLSIGDPARDTDSTHLRFAQHLVRQLLEIELAEVDNSIALWWDRRFDGPLPRRLHDQQWRFRYEVGSTAERSELIDAIAGSVPTWLARRIIDRRQAATDWHNTAMLASFEDGRAEPVDDQRSRYDDLARWSHHRYRATQSSLRAIAFGAGDEPGRVCVANMRLRIIREADDDHEVDLLPALSGGGRGAGVAGWVDACRLDDRSWLQRPGGQLVIEFDGNDHWLGKASDGQPIEVVVEIEFRFDPISPGNPFFDERFDEARAAHAKGADGGMINRLKRLISR